MKKKLKSVSAECDRLQAFRAECEDMIPDPDSNFPNNPDVLFVPTEESIRRLIAISDVSEVNLRYYMLRDHSEGMYRVKFVADQIFRQLPTLKPSFPQKFVYLPYAQRGVMSQRSAFDLPTFFYHFGETTLVDTAHKPEHEYRLNLENAGKKQSMKIENDYAVINEIDGDGKEKQVLRIERPTFSENRTEIVRNSYLEQKLLNFGKKCRKKETDKVKLQLRLNEIIQTKCTIRQACVFEKNGRTEVILLFEDLFMATGFMRDCGDSKECSVNELIGTYGTTEFKLSPDGCSMIRMSQIPRERLSKTEYSGIDDVDEKLREAFLATETYWTEEGKMKKGTRKRLVHKGNCLVDYLCPNLRILIRLSQQIVQPGRNPDEMEVNWTAREKLVYMAQQLVEDEDQQEQCDEGEKCKTVEQFLRMAYEVEENLDHKYTRISPAVMQEFKLQLLFAVRACLQCFKTSTFGFFESEMIDLLSRFASLYTLSLERIARLFLEIADDNEFLPTVLEVLASRATPADCPVLLEFYKLQPDKVEELMQKHPYLMIFGVVSSSPPLAFIRKYVQWLDEVLSVCVYQELVSHRSEQVHFRPPPVFKSPRGLPRKLRNPGADVQSPPEEDGKDERAEQLELLRRRLNCPPSFNFVFAISRSPSMAPPQLPRPEMPPRVDESRRLEGVPLLDSSMAKDFQYTPYRSRHNQL